MNDSLGRAFNPSVLFMMVMPFLVFGAIAGGLVYAYRRAQKNTDDTWRRADKPPMPTGETPISSGVDRQSNNC